MHVLKTIKPFLILPLLVITINLNSQSYYKTTSDSRLRSGPNIKSKSLGIIKKDERVNVIEKTNSSWFKIKYEGKTGFLSTKIISPIIEIPKAEEIPKIESQPVKSNYNLLYIIGAVVVIALTFIASSPNKKKKVNNNEPVSQTINKTTIEKDPNEKLIEHLLQNIKIEVTTLKSNKPGKDESIIDVTGDVYNLRNDPSNLLKYAEGVPPWKHQYVYSYSEINVATSEQINFYNVFKIKFLNNIYIDLEGNTNYSFILLFDLLNEYENHKDLGKLENQLNDLGNHYPKTESYARNFLIKKMEQVSDVKGIARLRSQDNNSYTYYTREYIDEYRLGNKYAKKLNLTQDEILWLNKFWNPNNVFLEMEGCCIETIKLYLATIKELDKQLKEKQTTIPKEVEFLQTEIQQFYQTNNASYSESYDNSYFKERAESEVFSTIFKRAENAIRESFGHKRKISGDFPYSAQSLIQEFERRVGLAVSQIIRSLLISINPPDQETEEELNAQNANRWKIGFEQLEKSFSEANKQEFITGIYLLERNNQKSPSIENIFFEASKFIAKFHNVESLKFYIYYLYYDLKSVRVDNKQLTKTIQKSLFKTNEQLNDFSKVVADLTKTKDLKKALEEVAKIYQSKRKKIQLDVSAIKEVEQQDQGTVDLLNEYLKDEFEDETTTVRTQEINNEEIKLEIESKTEEAKQWPYVDGVLLNDVQSNTIALFVQKSFSLPFNEMDNYCKSKGLFKNQLIDSINENCYEILNDVLIEEDGEVYTLNENYYDKISGND